MWRHYQLEYRIRTGFQSVPESFVVVDAEDVPQALTRHETIVLIFSR